MSARRVVLTTDNTAEPGHDGEMEREAQNNDEEVGLQRSINIPT